MFPSYINVIPSTGVQFSGIIEFTYILAVCCINNDTFSIVALVQYTIPMSCN